MSRMNIHFGFDMLFEKDTVQRKLHSKLINIFKTCSLSCSSCSLMSPVTLAVSVRVNEFYL